MNPWTWIRAWREKEEEDLPLHLQRGHLGELEAKKHLRGLGLKFLTANFRSSRGEVDLIVPDPECDRRVVGGLLPDRVLAHEPYREIPPL